MPPNLLSLTTLLVFFSLCTPLTAGALPPSHPARPWPQVLLAVCFLRRYTCIVVDRRELEKFSHTRLQRRGGTRSPDRRSQGMSDGSVTPGSPTSPRAKHARSSSRTGSVRSPTTSPRSPVSPVGTPAAHPVNAAKGASRGARLLTGLYWGFSPWKANVTAASSRGPVVLSLIPPTKVGLGSSSGSPSQHRRRNKKPASPAGLSRQLFNGEAKSPLSRASSTSAGGESSPAPYRARPLPPQRSAAVSVSTVQLRGEPPSPAPPGSVPRVSVDSAIARQEGRVVFVSSSEDDRPPLLVGGPAPYSSGGDLTEGEQKKGD